VVATAGLRSKQNTYMSVPLIFLMISNHYPTMVYGTSNDKMMVPGIVAAFVAVGWLLTKFFFTKSATKAPAEFEVKQAA